MPYAFHVRLLQTIHEVYHHETFAVELHFLLPHTVEKCTLEVYVFRLKTPHDT